jgi:hypothetical protein|tara:strand:+ start:696 stop:1205 length:510 start_codon:yes stop_codon:yes gene_type:complete
MGDSPTPTNNGYMRDIYQTTRNDYIDNNEPMIFNTRRSYSLKGIIQETPMSNLFFSDMNVKVIQMTIRYLVYEGKEKNIGFQSENELFAIMRSIYLQNANSILTSDKMLTNLRVLNKMVVDYSVKNIGDQLDQYDGYLKKISIAPVPMEHPRAGNTDSYTYDMSNIMLK